MGIALDPILALSWLLVGLVAATFLVLIWRALFADRAGGRRRCPKCWHNLHETPGLRCPECGHAVRKEAHFFRTRRRYGSALLLLVALLSSAFYVRLAATGQSLFDYAPNWLLLRAIVLSSTQPNAPDRIREALAARVMRKELSADDLAQLVERIVEGDADARPVSPAWEIRYGELIVLIATHALDAQVRTGDQQAPAANDAPYLAAFARFRTLPPRVQVRGPATWPADEPLLTEITVEEWWPPTTSARVTIRDLHDGSVRTVGLDSGGQSAPAYQLALAPLGPAESGPSDGEVTRRLEITIETRPTLLDGTRDPDAAWSGLWKTTESLSLRRADPVALEPVTDAATDDAIRSVFGAGIVAWRSGWRRLGLRFDPSRTNDESMRGMLIGLDIEVREGERVRRRSQMWWPAGGGVQLTRWEILTEDAEGLDGLFAESAVVDESGAEPAPSAAWTLRIRGRPEIALRALATLRGPGVTATPYTRAWTGDITLPIEVRAVESASPRRRWFTLHPDDEPRQEP
jgi:hypothetical protein